MIGRVVPLGRVVALVGQEGVGHRPQHRLRVAPADQGQHPLAVGDEDRLVADGAEVPGPVPVEQLEDLAQARRPGQTRHGGVGCRFVPAVHGLDQCLPGLAGSGHRGFVHGAHGPTAFPDVLGLGLLEIVQRPEDGQPTIGVGGGQGGLVDRMDHQHGMELEAHRRTRPDAAHARQQQRRQDLAVAQAASNPGGRLFQEAHPAAYPPGIGPRARSPAPAGRPDAAAPPRQQRRAATSTKRRGRPAPGPQPRWSRCQAAPFG